MLSFIGTSRWWVLALYLGKETFSTLMETQWRRNKLWTNRPPPFGRYCKSVTQSDDAVASPVSKNCKIVITLGEDWKNPDKLTHLYTNHVKVDKIRDFSLRMNCILLVLMLCLKNKPELWTQRFYFILFQLSKWIWTHKFTLSNQTATVLIVRSTIKQLLQSSWRSSLTLS